MKELKQNLRTMRGQNSEEGLKLFKIAKIYNTRAMCYCPYHISQKGSADLDITLEGKWASYWHCWSCQRSGKITRDELEELRTMRGKFQKDTKKKDWDKVNMQYKINKFKERIQSPFKVSPTTMILLEHGWDGQAHVFPMRSGEGTVVGIHRRWPNDNKGMLGNLGLFIPRIKFDPAKTLYITEGLSDLCAVLECGLQGIARPNANSGNEVLIRWLCFHSSQPRSITIIPDNDPAGEEGANKLHSQLNEVRLGESGESALYVIQRVPKTDLYDYFLEHGKENTKSWLLN